MPEGRIGIRKTKVRSDGYDSGPGRETVISIV
jgi:hypothetical protein